MGSFAALLRDVATETQIFISLPRDLILQNEIIQFWFSCGKGEDSSSSL